MKRVTKSARRPIGVILSVLLVICAVPLLAVTDVNGLPSETGQEVTTAESPDGLSWITDVIVTDNYSHVTDKLHPGNAQVQFEIKLNNFDQSKDVIFEGDTALLQESFVVLVNSAILNKSATTPVFKSPTIAPSSVYMFISDSEGKIAPLATDYTDERYPGETFYKYVLQFDTSPPAIDAWNNYAGISAFATLALTAVGAEDKDKAIVWIYNDEETKVVEYERGDSTPPTTVSLLSKDQELNPIEAKRIFDSIVPNGYGNDLAPAGSEVVTAENQYTVFKIRINEYGIAKLHTNSIAEDVSPAAFKEIVPPGMKIFSVDAGDNTYLGIKLARTYADPELGGMREYTDVTGQKVKYIDYLASKTNDIAFRGPSIYSMNGGISSVFGGNDDAAIYGLTGSFDAPVAGEHGGILNIGFGKAPAGQTDPTIYDDNVEYTLYVIMIPDKIPEDATELTNRVSLKYPEINEEQTDSENIFLTNNVGSAGLKKYIKLASGAYSSDEFVVTLPDAARVVNQAYRLVLPSISSSTYEVNKINFTDRADARFIKFTELSDVIVKAYKGIPAANADVSGATTTAALMTVNEFLKSSEDKNIGFKATNNAVFPSGYFYHTFDYTFKYENVPYGVAIKNTAFRSVFTVTPLEFTIVKKDASDESKALTGWEFNAYYAQASNSSIADLARPVLDIDGTAVTISDTSPIAHILPEGYSPKVEGSWHIVFVETKQPTGYPEEGNKGLQIPAKITSDNAGTLSVAPLPGDVAASNITFSAVTGIATVNAFNTPEEPTTPPVTPPTTPPLPPETPDKPLTPSGNPGEDLPVTPSGGPGNTLTDIDNDTPLTPAGAPGSTSPQTGDESVPGVMIILIIIAIIGLLIVRRQLMKIK